jgi:hypothetical protein
MSLDSSQHTAVANGGPDLRHATVSRRARARRARDSLRVQTTRLLAAACIADPRFPDEDVMPRVCALPFSNLGHQPLMDYRLLCSITWSAAFELAAAYEQRGKQLLRAWLWSALAYAPMAFLSTLSDHNAAFINVVGVAIALLVMYLRRPEFARTAAKIRADAISSLLAGRAGPTAEKFTTMLPSDFRWADVESGAVGIERAPVFFVRHESDPFPGLGWLQAKELFVCPRGASEENHVPDEDELYKRLTLALQSTFETDHTQYDAFGYAIAVDTATVYKDSAWLTDEGRPQLFVPIESVVTSLSLRDPRVSMRVYIGLQAILPKYMTQVSMLLRPFIAGDSAAFEIIATTLGPPIVGHNELLDILRTHHNASQSSLTKPSLFEAGPEFWAMPLGSKWYAAGDRSPLGTRMRGWLPAFKNLREAASRQTSQLERRSDYSFVKEPFGRAWQQDEINQAKELQAMHDRWVGYYMLVDNWRETHSLTLVRDHFGTAECRAVTRALYERIAKVALETFDDLGFDIDKYRDSSGHIVINAETIDKMIVGERITIRDSEKVSKKVSRDSSESSKDDTEPSSPNKK